MRISAEKKKHLTRISELKNNVKFQRESGAAMDADISEVWVLIYCTLIQGWAPGFFFF